jgi:hypothetical protein
MVWLPPGGAGSDRPIIRIDSTGGALPFRPAAVILVDPHRRAFEEGFFSMSTSYPHGIGPRAPFRSRSAPRRSCFPQIHTLETRELLTSAGIAPIDEAQYMLFLINRARANPAAEAQRLLVIAQTDPSIEAATRGWNLGTFAATLSSMPPRPPLAFDSGLIAAALTHDSAMLAANSQFHSARGYLNDASVATAADGQVFYPTTFGPWATGENVFAYTGNVSSQNLTDYVNFLYEGFMLDWGVPDLSHLENIMAPGPAEASPGGHVPFSEIGIGLQTNAYPTVPPPGNPQNPGDLGLNVGPVLATEEFGWRSGLADLTGVVYRDYSGTGSYMPGGEGVGGVTIEAVGLNGQGTYQTQTWSSGGYTLPLPPGSYSILGIGNVPYSQSTTVNISVDNVEWDVSYPGASADLPVPADYDGDGITDVAVYRPSTAQWFIMRSRLGPEVITFGQPNVDIPVPATYDGGAKADIAVYRPTTGQWFILAASGPEVVAFGQPVIDVPVPAAYDGGGKAEVAVYRPTTGEWFILGATGPRSVAFGQPIVDVPVPAAYDGGGKAEIAVYRPTTAQWLILGVSGPRSVMFGEANVDVPVPADYEGTGKTDIAVYRPTTGEWFISPATGGSRYAIFGGPNLDQPIVGDFDGDHKADIALFRPSTAQWLLLESTSGPHAVSFGEAGSLRPLTVLPPPSLPDYAASTARYAAPSAIEAVPPALPIALPQPPIRSPKRHSTSRARPVRQFRSLPIATPRKGGPARR